MLMRRIENTRCDCCGTDIRYGIKEESTAWKVYADCVNARCSCEFSVGRILRTEVDTIDAVYERAEQLSMAFFD